jgi:epsilon-lactone hydrolase
MGTEDVESRQPARVRVFDYLAQRAAELSALRPDDIAGLRITADRLAFDSRPIAGVRLYPIDSGELRGTWIAPEGVHSGRRMLYCHGGSFLFGDMRLFGGFVSRLAVAAKTCVFFVDYRLAPENLYPAAHEDCFAALQYVAATGPNETASATEVSVAGDSCGAALAVSTALHGASRGLRISVVLAFSPFVDFSVSSRSAVTNEGCDPILTAAIARACAAGYAPGMSTLDPRLSPLFADLSALGRLHVQGSMSDPLRDDSVRLCERAHELGVPAELHLWPAVPHQWYLFTDELPEVRRGLEVAAAFLQGQRCGDVSPSI